MDFRGVFWGIFVDFWESRVSILETLTTGATRDGKDEGEVEKKTRKRGNRETKGTGVSHLRKTLRHLCLQLRVLPMP